MVRGEVNPHKRGAKATAETVLGDVVGDAGVAPTDRHHRRRQVDRPLGLLPPHVVEQEEGVEADRVVDRPVVAPPQCPMLVAARGNVTYRHPCHATRPPSGWKVWPVASVKRMRAMPPLPSPSIQRPSARGWPSILRRVPTSAQPAGTCGRARIGYRSSSEPVAGPRPLSCGRSASGTVRTRPSRRRRRPPATRRDPPGPWPEGGRSRRSGGSPSTGVQRDVVIAVLTRRPKRYGPVASPGNGTCTTASFCPASSDSRREGTCRPASTSVRNRTPSNASADGLSTRIVTCPSKG